MLFRSGDRLFDASGVLHLGQNGPNPFNASTVIAFETIEKGPVQLYVLDMLGRRVRTLVDETLEPGTYQRMLDLGEYPSGSYLCVLVTATAQRMIRMLIARKEAAAAVISAPDAGPEQREAAKRTILELTSAINELKIQA